MFNLTEYVSYLANHDPLMFIAQFIVLPLGTLAAIIGLGAWYKSRQQHKRDYSFINSNNNSSK